MFLFLKNLELMQFSFSGEPKSSTDSPKWTENTVDSGTNNNSSYSKIGGIRSLYALLGAAAAIIGTIVLLILFMVYMYSRRSLRNSNTPGNLFLFLKFVINYVNTFIYFYFL